MPDRGQKQNRLSMVCLHYLVIIRGQFDAGDEKIVIFGPLRAQVATILHRLGRLKVPCETKVEPMR